MYDVVDVLVRINPFSRMHLLIFFHTLHTFLFTSLPVSSKFTVAVMRYDVMVLFLLCVPLSQPPFLPSQLPSSIFHSFVYDDILHFVERKEMFDGKSWIMYAGVITLEMRKNPSPRNFQPFFSHLLHTML